MKRTAEQYDMTTDRAAAGKAGNGLGYYGLQHGCCQIRP
jgi:hypothetical protein